MITLDDYKVMLGNKGRTMGDARKNQTDSVIDITFTNDPSYKRAYLLDKNNGWEYVDAKYFKHTTPSILRDQVDRYIQFRPKVHYPIGTYLFIPDDTSPDIGFVDDTPQYPMENADFDLSKLWFIVGINNETQFTLYNILQCNWVFKWIAKVNGKSKLLKTYGAARSASSYTSGIWSADYSTSLDQITQAWLPDVYNVYGDSIADYHLDDSRTIMHGERFMITTNILDPKVYLTSKIVDMNPQGVIKLTLKQDDFNVKRDNVKEMVCDFWDDSGDNQADVGKTELPPNIRTSTFVWAYVNDSGELEEYHDGHTEPLQLGNTVYFHVVFSDEEITPVWKINLIDEDNEYSAKEHERLEKMMVLNPMENGFVSLRPGKAGSLKGKKFRLSVSDANGDYYSHKDLEVANET